MAPIPLFIRLRGLLTRDRDEFWWKYFTDEELNLRKMDVWQLAGVIEEACVRPGMARQKIVAEHLLNVRLAAVQAKASWGAGVLGFVGALLGGALSVGLSAHFQATPQFVSKPVASVPAPAASGATLAASVPSPALSAPAPVAASQAFPQSSRAAKE